MYDTQRWEARSGNFAERLRRLCSIWRRACGDMPHSIFDEKKDGIKDSLHSG